MGQRGDQRTQNTFPLPMRLSCRHTCGLQGARGVLPQGSVQLGSLLGQTQPVSHRNQRGCSWRADFGDLYFQTGGVLGICTFNSLPGNSVVVWCGSH